ncbi:protein of unknown function [Nitrosotalea devaniterrae]|uniref:Uncharacterized protein n=1 Tax=Nitrosotalea devaniterrae TaxID=1078905 RepID=A0A128A585_9ARCH|nr:protein of unknown function [Candidatus Nitrosotalea devanaterra]
MIPDGNEEIFENFPTVVADGAYCHFLEDFISLIFYQTRVFPRLEKDGKTAIAPKRREILADIRFSREALRKLMNEIEQGLELYPAYTLMKGKDGFLTGLDPMNTLSKDSTISKLSLTKAEFDHLKNNILVDMSTQLTKEGEKVYNDLLIKIIFEHEDELREIVRKYEKKPTVRKERNVKSKSK